MDTNPPVGLEPARFQRIEPVTVPVRPRRRPARVERHPAPQSRSGSGAPILGPRSTDPWTRSVRALRRSPIPFAILLLSLVGGGLLRTINLVSNPPGVNQDEAVTAYDAWSIWRTGRDHHGAPFPFWVLETFTDWSSPLLTFILAPFVGLFGLDIEVVRLVTAGLGIVMILGVFGFTRELTASYWTAAAAAVFAAISPWSVHYSRYALLPIVAMAGGMLLLWCLLWTFRTRSETGLVLSALLAGLTLLGYHTMKFYVPMLGAVVLILYWRQVFRFPVRTLINATAVFGFIAGPALFMTFRDPDVGRRNSYLLITSQDDFGLRVLVDSYWSYISPDFLFRKGDGDPTHTMPGHGLELWFIAPLILLGLAIVVWRVVAPGRLLPDRRSNLLMLAATLLAPLPGALTQFQATNRTAFLSPLLAVLCGMAVAGLAVALLRLLRPIRRQSWRIAVVATLLAILAVPAARQATSTYRYYFTKYPHEYSVTWGFHHGLVQAIEFGYPLIDQYDTVWVGDANQTYIFLLFAGRIDPTIAQREFADANPSVTEYDVRRWRNVHFAPNYQSPPDTVPVDQLAVLYTSPHRDGEVFYEVRGGTVRGERILVIDSPNR